MWVFLTVYTTKPQINKVCLIYDIGFNIVNNNDFSHKFIIFVLRTFHFSFLTL